LAWDVVVIHPSMSATDTWIDDFVEPGSGFSFRKVARPASRAKSWHDRKDSLPLLDWITHFRHGFRAMTSKADIVVANFPPLILTCCFWKIALLRRTKVVGWSFNFGDGSRSRLAKAAGLLFRSASKLIIHSTKERDRYATAFGLDKDQLIFVPLQRGDLARIEVDGLEIPGQEYAIAMGSAGRDYKTLVEAMSSLDFNLLLIAKDSSVQGIDLPENVDLRSGLTLEECLVLAKNAEFMVVPIGELENASGQVTVVSAMQLGLPIIATRCPGTVDYLTDQKDALMVEPFDVSAMRAAIQEVHTNKGLASSLGERARKTWKKAFSDEVAGTNLANVLRTVVA